MTNPHAIVHYSAGIDRAHEQIPEHQAHRGHDFRVNLGCNISRVMIDLDDVDFDYGCEDTLDNCRDYDLHLHSQWGYRVSGHTVS